MGLKMTTESDLAPAIPEPYTKPKPRPSRSPEQAAQVRLRNRRRQYLVLHPEYFSSVEHELAAPLLYDTLIRRFQSTSEREAEGRAKGYGRILEGSLLRSEAQLERVAGSYAGVAPRLTASANAPNTVSQDAALESLEPPPEDKSEGRTRWEDFLRERFVRGDDEEFDYGPVDRDPDLDFVERQEEEDRWFDEEEEEWVDGEGDVKTESRSRTGETGVQDF